MGFLLEVVSRSKGSFLSGRSKIGLDRILNWQGLGKNPLKGGPITKSN